MKANSDGKIEIYAPSGMVQVTPMSIDGYAVSKFGNNPFDQFSTEPIPIAAGQTHDFGTFTLVKTVELTGVVLDQDEKPIAGAEVLVGYSGTNYGTVPEKTNAEGSFVIRGLNPEGGVVGVTAHKGYAITAAPVGVDPGKPEGELRVIISPRHAAYIRLRIGPCRQANRWGDHRIDALRSLSQPEWRCHRPRYGRESRANR